jgi:hypothetical protein
MPPTLGALLTARPAKRNHRDQTMAKLGHDDDEPVSRHVEDPNDDTDPTQQQDKVDPSVPAATRSPGRTPASSRSAATQL